MIETVRGQVQPDELGRTLGHEHVFVLTPDSQANWFDEWDEDQRISEAVAQLRQLTSAGYRTLVDPTVDGLGRDVSRIRRVNDQVPELNIVVATGIYTWADVPFFFAFRPDASMVQAFVRDLTEGIKGTDGVKAGFLKCAVHEAGLVQGVERVLRNVCGAHRMTGSPVMVHTHAGSRNGLEIRGVLAEESVPPSSVVLAHCGAAEIEYLATLADHGFFLGMDQFGLPTAPDAADRIRLVVEMCERGYSESMMLSHDTASYIDWIDPSVRLPDWHYLHIERDVLPRLREAGVTEAQINQMLVDNPRRWLTSRGV